MIYFKLPSRTPHNSKLWFIRLEDDFLWPRWPVSIFDEQLPLLKLFLLLKLLPLRDTPPEPVLMSMLNQLSSYSHVPSSDVFPRPFFFMGFEISPVRVLSLPSLQALAHWKRSTLFMFEIPSTSKISIRPSKIPNTRVPGWAKSYLICSASLHPCLRLMQNLWNVCASQYQVRPQKYRIWYQTYQIHHLK